MRKLILTCLLALTLNCFAQTHKSMKKPSSAGPDKTYLQQILDGWNTLDPSHVAQFYAGGPHTYFDLAPLKYSSWTEYEAGSRDLLAAYKSLNLTVNDDAELHHHGDLVWGTATVKEDATLKSGKHEMATFRWTIVFENQSGKWLIVHEHFSAPVQ
jgi:ketosteroid isomerase-like protein